MPQALRFMLKVSIFAKKNLSMNHIQSIINQYLSFQKIQPPRSLGIPPQYLLAFFLFCAVLPACRVKEGCAASQKGYTNNMERSKKHGKTSLFPKSVTKKLKH